PIRHASDRAAVSVCNPRVGEQGEARTRFAAGSESRGRKLYALSSETRTVANYGRARPNANLERCGSATTQCSGFASSLSLDVGTRGNACRRTRERGSCLSVRFLWFLLSRSA